MMDILQNKYKILLSMHFNDNGSPNVPNEQCNTHFLVDYYANVFEFYGHFVTHFPDKLSP